MSDEVNCQDWQSAVYVIALDVEKAAVLLYQNDDGDYYLPTFTVEGGVWETTTAKMQEQIGPTLEIEGQVLYRALYEEDKDICRGKAVLIMDTNEAAGLRGEWFSLAELSDLSLVEADYRSIIETALKELEMGVVPEKRPPWTRPGWY